MKKLFLLLGLCLCACGTSVANRQNSRKFVGQYRCWEITTNTELITHFYYSVYDETTQTSNVKEFNGYIDEWIPCDNSQSFYNKYTNYNVVLFGIK